MDLPESEKLTLSLCCCKDRPSAWKAIYFECLTSGKHFLEQVLVSCAFYVWLPGYSLIVFNHVGRKLSNAIVHVSSWQVTALDLIKHKEFDQLRDVLKLEFRPLSRLLLLLGWTHCRSLSSAKMLLSILHLDQVRRPRPPTPAVLAALAFADLLLPSQAPANDSVLQEFADVLSSQLGLLEWCQHNNT